MGLSIHYCGRLADIQQINSLIDELSDISETMNWSWTSLDEDWNKPATAKLMHSNRGAEITGHLPLKGIGITVHPNCESVSFYFDSQGNLRDPLAMIMILEGNLKPEDTYVSVKTQFSNPDVHITIIKLLKYLQKRYIPDLQDIDEGDYWESGDEERLKEKMAFLDEKIDMVADALSSVDFVDFSEYTESEMVSLIEEILRKKLRSD